MSRPALATWVAVVATAAFMTPDGQAQTAGPVSAVFAQVGTVRSTRSVAVGLTSDWASGWAFAGGRLGGYWEGSFAEWSYRASRDTGGGQGHLTQFALKPVFRFRPDDGTSPWFVEAGVGLTVTNRVYRTERKMFSSRFDFGDHLALGRSFGEAGRHEVALRVEHFSNGGIHEPNPGETFLQLRYACRF